MSQKLWRLISQIHLVLLREYMRFSIICQKLDQSFKTFLTRSLLNTVRIPNHQYFSWRFKLCYLSHFQNSQHWKLLFILLLLVYNLQIGWYLWCEQIALCWELMDECTWLYPDVLISDLQLSCIARFSKLNPKHPQHRINTLHITSTNLKDLTLFTDSKLYRF